MKRNLIAGEKVEFKKTVMPGDLASFNGEVLHPVYATFALARDFEWTGRQFVLMVKDDDEEGVGTFVNVIHKAPAFEGEEIVFKGYIAEVNGSELICSISAFVNDKLIAEGMTGQKILKKERLGILFKNKNE